MFIKFITKAKKWWIAKILVTLDA